MSDIAIKVEGLGKRYRLGLQESRKDTLAGQIGQVITSPVRNLKRLRQMTRFNEEDESIFWALRDINFEVKEGEVLGIIGHNGAGKSTLLKLLSSITMPTEGRISLHGRVAALLEVGTGFHPDLSGRENIYMNGTILGMTKKEIDAKLDEIIDFSGVEKHIDTRVKFFSSGMKVRLGFAVAAHLDPEILIIDEVLAVGDAEFQKKCLGKMEDVSSSGRTVLFVSHNLMAVRNLCKTSMVLKQGQKVFHGPTDEAVNHYLREYGSTKLKSVFSPEDAPGGEHARLLRAEVMPSPGKDFPLESGDGFVLEFDFLYKGDPNTNLDVTFQLKDELQNMVFVGTTKTEPAQNFGHGLFKARCEIPSDLMQEGSYTVSSLMLFKNRGFKLLAYPNSLQFDFIPPQNGSLGWMGKKLGVVRPKLKWDLSHEHGF